MVLFTEDGSMIQSDLTVQDGRALQKLLVMLDTTIDELDRKVFEQAYRPRLNLDQQVERAKGADFKTLEKTQRDELLEGRNLVAQLIGFGVRYAHDLSPRDYIVQSDGFLAHRT